MPSAGTRATRTNCEPTGTIWRDIVSRPCGTQALGVAFRARSVRVVRDPAGAGAITGERPIYADNPLERQDGDLGSQRSPHPRSPICRQPKFEINHPLALLFNSVPSNPSHL